MGLKNKVLDFPQLNVFSARFTYLLYNWRSEEFQLNTNVKSSFCSNPGMGWLIIKKCRFYCFFNKTFLNAFDQAIQSISPIDDNQSIEFRSIRAQSSKVGNNTLQNIAIRQKMVIVTLASCRLKNVTADKKTRTRTTPVIPRVFGLRPQTKRLLN